MDYCTTDLRKPPSIIPATHIVLNTRIQHLLEVDLSVENVTPDVECMYQEIQVNGNGCGQWGGIKVNGVESRSVRWNQGQ